MREPQGIAPLWEALVAYKEAQILPFHTPGHKLRSGVFRRLEEHLGTGLFAMDPSDEVVSVACDNQFERVLEHAQALAAQAFAAAGTLFLTNGTTGGLHTALLPHTGPVLVPRFSHQSVYSSLALSMAQPAYLPAALDATWHLPLQPTAEEWRQALMQVQPAAAVVTYPTYYGSIPELAAMAQLSKEHQCELIVDEAHGAHFGFHPSLPPAAMAVGADISVQSTHKTMGALTGSSMLHCRTTALTQRSQRSLQFLQTTSPSLFALAVLDEVRRVWEEQGTAMVENVLLLAQTLRQQLAAIPEVVLPPPAADPTKILFSLERVGMTGQDVEAVLREAYGIQLEMSDARWVLALITVGDTDGAVNALANAVRSICRERRKDAVALVHETLTWPALPKSQMGMRQASFAAARRLPLSEAAGSLSADFITPYPPGVPLLVPGELWDPALVDYVRQIMRRQWFVRGVAEEMVWIVEDSADF